ncbi:hypothetical protein T07_2193, partial [Trichinella nelsoni]
LLRGGFDPLPQRTISDRRALGLMTERHAVQQWLLHRLKNKVRSTHAREKDLQSPVAIDPSHEHQLNHYVLP